jgi:hypothetical protein
MRVHRGAAFGPPFSCGTTGLRVSSRRFDLTGGVARALDSTPREASPMSELVLHKKARQLCVGEGKSWSLKDFENGVPGVTMLTGCRRREETARVSEPSESDA